MEGKLVIAPHDLSDREFTLEWFQEEDKIRFEWEETHSGDTDTYETVEITLGELYNLLNINHTHEERQKVLAGRQLDTRIEKLKKVVERQQHENFELREIKVKYDKLIKAVAKAAEGG